MQKSYHVGAYYFPNYHVDARNESVHGPGWTEWDLVKRAEPRFPGHQQPKMPLWGCEDEADPKAMARKIDAAADHGLDYFIFDWYMYEDGPFLQRGLDEGFLGAANNQRVKFCLMWANHDWTNIHPAKAHAREKHWEASRGYLLYPGKVSPEAFDRIVAHVIGRYFGHPSYWRIAGCPYFSVYDLTKLIAGFGSLEQTRAGIDRFRAKVRAAGFPDLHFNAVVWGRTILPGETAPTDPKRVVDALGFDSITSYVWIHHAGMPHFPFTEYALVRDRYLAYWDSAEKTFAQPYFPNVTTGWDASPRTVQSDRYLNLGYPFCPILANNTPAAFREALALTKSRLDRRSGLKILNINAWNEWTEGSYLEPDMLNGLAYLEAIRDVFGR